MDLNKAREYFSQDKFASQAAGIEIDDAAPDYAKCSMKITDGHKNALGAVMGGAIFTLADYAFAIASNLEKPPTVSLTSNITFLSPAKGGVLYAEAKPVRSGRSTCTFIIEITDDAQTHVATVVTTGFRKAAQ